MNIIISGHHLEVTPPMRDYVSSKLERVARHFDQIVDVRVLLALDNQPDKERRHRAECNIRVRGNDIRAESCQQDMYAAIDDLVDKLDRQIVRHKDKVKDVDAEAQRKLMQQEAQEQ